MIIAIVFIAFYGVGLLMILKIILEAIAMFTTNTKNGRKVLINKFDETFQGYSLLMYKDMPIGIKQNDTNIAEDLVMDKPPLFITHSEMLGIYEKTIKKIKIREAELKND